MNKEPINIIRNLLAVIAMVVLGLLLTGLGVKMVEKNFNRDLNQVTSIKGKIKNTLIVTKAERIGVRPAVHADMDLFVLELDSHQSYFAVHMPNQDYSELNEKLGIGDDITIYYDDTPVEKLTNNVYQIEKQDSIVVDHHDYKRNHTIAGIAFLFFGLLMFGVVAWYVKTKDFKNWG